VSSRRRLAPETIEARAFAHGRIAVAFAPRFFVLLGVGLLWVLPAIVDSRFVYAMAAWDAIVVFAWAIDLWRLPTPEHVIVQRSWLAPPALSVASDVQLMLRGANGAIARAVVVDAVPRQLRAEPPSLLLAGAPNGAAVAPYTIVPRERGDVAIGDAYVRYGSRFGLAERWARAPIAQRVVVYPNLEEARHESMFLQRRRQIEVERRTQRIRGAGRSFESLREHRDGDEIRDVCWTASARRGKLVTRVYESEKSQAIWIVIDAGRLMRARVADLTKLDLAVNAALTLSQVAVASGDRVGLLAYGQRIGHRVPAGSGAAHLRRLVEQLAIVRAEESEADHLQAAGRLLADQQQRGLVVWITDLPDAAMTPDVVTAAAALMTRHLVLFVVIGQTDLQQLAARDPRTTGEMYETAAAQEVVHRRDLLLAQLRARGALALDSRGRLSPALVNAYLEIKQRNRL
jgi:uncharacterized protein (DUF58 family)